ncbi:MAG: hypothetical protein V4480_01120 [Patescibacteria group bacterium]
MRLRAVIGVLLAIIAIYGLFKAIPLISGPQIRLTTTTAPDTGLTVLSGTAIHTETLTLDGGTLLIDPDGAFSESLTLPRGGAILTLTATDRFGRSRTLERTVITQ